MSEFWANVGSQLIVAGVIGGAGVAATFIVLGKRVDQLEKTASDLREELLRQNEAVSAKADADQVAIKHAEIEGRLRSQDSQLTTLSVAMSAVQTDVRWIRETLEKRERGTR